MVRRKAAAAAARSEILSALAEGTGVSKRDVARVFDRLGALIGRNPGKRGPETSEGSP